MKLRIAAFVSDEDGRERVADLADALDLEVVEVDDSADLDDYDGVVIADESAVTLRLIRSPRPQQEPPGDAPTAPVAGASALTAAGAAVLFGGVPSAVASAATGALMAARHERRRRSGKRVGRRPRKPSRATTQLIADLRPGSLASIAVELNRRGIPSPQGKAWHPTTVSRAIRSSRDETRMVLRRLGNLLTELREHEPVDGDALCELGRRHEFHHHRLWQAFQPGVEHGAPYDEPMAGRYAPPVEKGRDGYRCSPQGRKLLEVWHRSEDLDDAVEALLLEIKRAGGGDGVDPRAFGQLCDRGKVSAADLPDALVRFDSAAGLFALTPEGEQVAETWDALTNDDPRLRLDIDYWPEPAEEDRLPATWDWADDPLLPGEAP